MKSWAVPKGPSRDPTVRRLAMQVEDHPIAYNTFEGTIPQGEYGGGTVMLWDRGTYAPVEGADDANASVHRQLAKGKLVVTFDGERMQGRWTLVRTGSPDPDKPQWLFIKGHDDYASSKVDLVAMTPTSVDSGRTMDEIAGDADRVWRSNRR
jgi:bifunctional non-homologous end joining protein LigD